MKLFGNFTDQEKESYEEIQNTTIVFNYGTRFML
jgi:hypothetical protein